MAAWLSQTATITITGTNDAPTVTTTAVTTSAGEDDGNFVLTLLDNAFDVEYRRCIKCC